MVTLTKQKNKKTVAIIDIGSNFVKMIVCEQKANHMHQLDTLKKPLRLGHEVFSSGMISFESLKELCEILKGYQAVMEEYAVGNYAVIATSAMREAKNRDFVLDQIKVKTGITVNICDDSQEKSMIYYAVIRDLAGDLNGQAENKKTLIAHTGTGSIGLCIHENDVISYAQNIPMGSLKIHDMLGDIVATNHAFYNAVEEYLDVVFANIIMPSPNKTIDNLVLAGTEMDLMAKLCDAKLENSVYRISGESIKELFHTVRKTSLEQLSLKHHISEDRAEMFYSSLSIFCRLINLTQAEQILVPQVELADAFLQKMLFKNWTAEYDTYMEKSAIACAKTFATRYCCNANHYNTVANFSVKLFDRLNRLHGLTHTHRTILQIASILHDCGYFINSKGGRSSHIIRNLDICGLSYDDVEVAALISNFNETYEPDFDKTEYPDFTKEQLLLCSKLTAIFRLSNSLDKSKKQKLKDIRVKLREDEIVISGVCDENLDLEKWAFRRCSPYFKDVLGIQPVLQIKSTMI